jgi:hypothetical protein
MGARGGWSDEGATVGVDVEDMASLREKIG